MAGSDLIILGTLLDDAAEPGETMTEGVLEDDGTTYVELQEGGLGDGRGR